MSGNRWAGVGVVAVLLSIVVAVLVIRSNHASPDSAVVGEPIIFPGEPNSLSSPLDLESVDGDLWIATTTEDGLVRRFDPETQSQIDSVFVAKNFGPLEAAHGFLWGFDSREGRHGRFGRIDPATMRVRFTPMPRFSGMAQSPDSVWVLDSYWRSKTSRLVELDPQSGLVRRRIRLQGSYEDLAYVEGKLWLSEEVPPRVVAVDPHPGEASGPSVQLAGTSPMALGNVGGRLLVIGDSNTAVGERPRYHLLVIDPRSGRLRAKTSTGSAKPMAWVLASGHLWIALSSEEHPSEVRAFDPMTLNPTGRPIRVGVFPEDLAFAGGALWVIDGSEQSLRRVEPTTAGSDAIPPPTPTQERELRVLEELREASDR